MAKQVNQRELRNNSGEIMRALDRGESFIVTSNGRPVADLKPIRRRQFVRAEDAIAAFAGAPAIDFKRFREDVDSYLNQDPTPRG